jgi:hypothetical protein
MTRQTHITTKKAIVGKTRRQAKTDNLFQPSSFCVQTHLQEKTLLANGLRYPLGVGV